MFRNICSRQPKSNFGVIWASSAEDELASMHKTGISYICRTKTIYLFESEQSRIIQNFDCSQKNIWKWLTNSVICTFFINIRIISRWIKRRFRVKLAVFWNRWREYFVFFVNRALNFSFHHLAFAVFVIISFSCLLNSSISFFLLCQTVLTYWQVKTGQ